jgi:hypothetical protein
MSGEQTPTGLLEMSDEEFLKLASAPEAPDSSDSPSGSEAPETPADPVDPPAETQAEETAPETVASETPGQTDQDDGTVLQDKSQGQEQPQASVTVTAPQVTTGKGSDAKAPKDADPSAATTETRQSTPDYEAFYKRVMTPFKANGKTIELRTPDEAVQLMQQGANYTRKMQELAPHRKLILMLENNGLLDEGKLSYLIDLDKKNPAAIQKLVKDAGIDPMEIDTSVDPSYRGGNHRVSDEEVAFTAVMDDLRSSQSGTETLQHINARWDQASKEVLWSSPELMHLFHSQRENGIYDAITSELERRRTLGLIAANTPFITAYKSVGDEMNAAGVFSRMGGQTPAPAPKPAAAPVVTRVQQPKPSVVNDDRANAASPTRMTPQKANKSLNPLAMSDEDFLKMSHRP